MSGLRRRLRDYLAVRRGLGFKLERESRLLPDFVAHVEHHNSTCVTVALAEQWARQPEGGHPAWWGLRMTMVRGFAMHLLALDPRTEVPPIGLLPPQVRRLTPYLYSEHEVAQILAATRARLTPFRGETLATLVALLAATGMRVGEVIALDRGDVDLADGVLVIRHGKFGKSREVPIHPTAVHALAAYARLRDKKVRRPADPAFLLTAVGTRLNYKNVHFVFHELVRTVGLKHRTPNCRPRIHDLRHTFAVRTLISWYRGDLDVQALMPRLSTYLGHVNPVSTYWYLSATPELMGLAMRRLDRANRRRS